MATVIRGSDNFDTADNATQTELDNKVVGKVLQVVQSKKTDTLTSTSTNYFDIGLSVSITPSSVNSKILVLISVSGSSVNAASGGIRAMRNSDYIGLADSAGNRRRTSFAGGLHTGDGSGDVNMTLNATAEILDSPNTTSAITYKVQAVTQGQTIYINRTEHDSDSTDRPRSVSTITVMEIGA